MQDLSPAELASLADYLAGELPPGEMAKVHDWLGAHPQYAHSLDALARTRFDASPLEQERTFRFPERMAAISASLADRVERLTDTPHRDTPRREAPAAKRRTRSVWTGPRNRWGLWGGSLTVAAVCTLVMLQRPTTANSPVVRYDTRTAERAAITLPDGTSVLLAPATTLAYHVDPKGAHIVDLQGQAFFHVEHSPAHVFSVRTGAVTTRVLGTAFGVRRYREEQLTEIAVTEGKIAADNIVGSSVVTAGMVVALADSTSAHQIRQNASDAVSWTKGRLSFRSVPVSTMLESLGRWSGYRFNLTDSALTTRVVTAELDVKDLPETLNILKTLLNVTIHMDGNVVVLRVQHNAGHAPARQRDVRKFLPIYQGVGK